MSRLAPVRDDTDMRTAFSCTASHTSLCATPLASGAAACVSAFRLRSSACEMCGAAAKSADSLRQRPCSTHETGIVRLDFASTSTLTLRIRFCFAPSSSSPSYSRTRSASGFSTTSSGTVPDSLVSRMRRPPASASSSVT